VEINKPMDVMANWTVVNLEYYEYPQPKAIQYKLLQEQHEVTVRYHAVKVDVDGDMSQYVPQQ
jgi:hypothetical protein